MTETRLVRRRGAAQLRAALPTALLLFLVTAWTLPVQVRAQETDDPTSETAVAQPDDTAGVDEFSSEPEEECLPPSTQEWVLIAAGTVAIFLVCFFLLVRVVQRYFIRRDWSATYGRHWGISLVLLLSSLGMLPLAYLITGCVHPRFWVWILFPLALWVLHGLYILVVVRSE
ncbi:MAG TPA: hypothetical protein VE078_06480 [Thermoanaerobaculia bacterium]|nr:hypothetical protein [Thermoanaerobaculia bacterium]